MNRREHMKWCKDRALKYVDDGEFSQAIASMISDLGKHEDTAGSVSLGASLGMIALMENTDKSMREFINGVN